ncbi:hypothetical protein [Shewanella sp.]|uniref:hypothetical protein n=1 Tax=Shewanella sp. TaxID=50422 RepID=UPI001B73394C|nr:hypothetical protein [Shewanella sp.]MBP6518669.1 hypothetical protein [Shewanella sp.]
MSSGFYISKEDFVKMPERTQSDILNTVTGGQSETSETEYKGSAADLSSLQAATLVKGLSSKTRNVLKTIVELPYIEKGFWEADLAYELKCKPESLSGVWSGLTRRTRTITSDKSAYLIDWKWDEEMEGNLGSLNTVTLKNLKIALNVR